MLLKNIIVIENFTCNIVFSEANLSLGLVNILQNYIAEMVRWHLKTWITDYKRVQENFHSLKKKKKRHKMSLYADWVPIQALHGILG